MDKEIQSFQFIFTGQQYFVLIVKSDSKFNLNFSCYLSILFNLFFTHLCL